MHVQGRLAAAARHDLDHREGPAVGRPDPRDRRAALVCLTERGWEEVRVALRIIAAIEEEWSRLLGTERMAQLRELLSELGHKALAREAPTPGPRKSTARRAP
jgi:hypothetical protein